MPSWKANAPEVADRVSISVLLAPSHSASGVLRISRVAGPPFTLTTEIVAPWQRKLKQLLNQMSEPSGETGFVPGPHAWAVTPSGVNAALPSVGPTDSIPLPKKLAVARTSNRLPPANSAYC